MSSDYYFRKWKRVLTQLQTLVDIDIEYQENRLHDKVRCVIVQRLSGSLAGYMAVYTQAMDCLQFNLQHQKNEYMKEIILYINCRIVELKRQLEKLERSNYQFISQGLSDMKLTPYDVEVSDIPEVAVRPPHVNAALEDIVKRVEEERKRIEEENEIAMAQSMAEHLSETAPEIVDWWNIDEQEEDNNVAENVAVESLDEDQLKRRNLLNKILAQEKTRQTLQRNQQYKQKRELWTKDLEGKATPLARIELKIRAAEMIQSYVRAYFEFKRKKIKDCKRDEMLGLRICGKPKCEARDKDKELNQKHIEKKIKYESEWRAALEEMKTQYLKNKAGEIQEDYRDEIRSWFQKWYEEIWFLYDIPKSNQGGSTLILNGTVPEPGEWVEANQLYIEQIKAKKGKSKEQLKQEQNAIKKEAQMLKRQEAMRKKQEEALQRKMKKNPNMHPGYTYPKSKQIGNLHEAINKYHHNWDRLDAYETIDVKEKSVKDIDENNVWSEVKQGLRPTVDDDMRIEQKKIKIALKEQYALLEKEWPDVIMPQKFPKITTKTHPKLVITEDIADQMVTLALSDNFKDYPRIKFEDFKGEPNYAGDDLRCNFVHAIPIAGETRHVWWERCKELIQGYRKILLVGPVGSGKAVLTYIMATVNNAVLFEIEPTRFDDNTTEEDLKKLINSTAACAKAFQPSVIFLKHVERLFYTKAQKGECLDVKMLRKYLIRNLMKKFHKTDKVTVVGSLTDPWLTKSSKLVKLFPSILLMPDTTYTTTRLLLSEWVSNNRMVPSDLNISCLAQALKGYSYGFLQNRLERFLSPERVVKMAMKGLNPVEIYDYILRDEDGTKEYDKYLQWYTDKTHWGKVEKKHLLAQLEFQAVAKKYAEQMEKKKKMQSAASSLAGSVATMH